MNDVEKIQKNVEASLAVENVKPSNKAKKITREYLEGKITSCEAIKKIKDYWIGGKIDDKK